MPKNNLKDQLILHKEFNVVIPQDELPDARREELIRYLADVTGVMPNFPDDWSWQWTVNKGPIVGVLTKRLSKFFHDKHGIDLSQAVLQAVGNVAKKNIAPASNYIFDFTDTIDWSKGQFGDGESCFWGSNRGAKNMLEEHGAYSMRFYYSRGKTSWRGRARCWMITDYPHGLIIFNAYDKQADGRADRYQGEAKVIELVTMARILSIHLGVSYKKVVFTNKDSDSGLLYINSRAGYLIGPNEVISKISEVDIRYDNPKTICAKCRESIPEDRARITKGGVIMCKKCYEEEYASCRGCGAEFPVELAQVYPGNGYKYCPSCITKNFCTCDICSNNFVPQSESITLWDKPGHSICHNCHSKHRKFVQCPDCSKVYSIDFNVSRCYCKKFKNVSKEKPAVKQCSNCGMGIRGKEYHVKESKEPLCHICAPEPDPESEGHEETGKKSRLSPVEE